MHNKLGKGIQVIFIEKEDKKKNVKIMRLQTKGGNANKKDCCRETKRR